MVLEHRLTLPRIGQFSTEFGGIFIGVCPGQDGQSDYALIAHDDDRTLFKDVQWGPYGVDVKHANSHWDGAANTLAMAAAKSQLALDATALEIDGFAGFYLPAHHELRMLKLVAPYLIVDDWHWSSTLSSANNAYIQVFADGFTFFNAKVNSYRARVVRRFLIHSSI